MMSRIPLKGWLLVLGLLAVGWVGPGLTQSTPPQPANGPSAGLAAWDGIAKVLQHPRCLNCHQVDTPLQGDSRRPHIPNVVRGTDNHGVVGMRCSNCHNETGNNPTSGVPGAPHWQLAPTSMQWQGLSSGDLCRALKDPERNGKRALDDLVHHMGPQGDPLVLWAWNPGAGREAIPMSHPAFIDLLKTWARGGGPCPQ